MLERALLELDMAVCDDCGSDSRSRGAFVIRRDPRYRRQTYLRKYAIESARPRHCEQSHQWLFDVERFFSCAQPFSVILARLK